MTYMAQKQPRLALHRLSTSWLSGSLVGYSFRRAALARTGEDARASIFGRTPFRLCGCHLNSRLRQVGAVLEVVLQDFRGQSRAYGTGFGRDRAHHLAPANYFRRGQARDFSGQHEVDLELRVGSDGFFRLEEHSGAADVFGCALTPAAFSHQPVFQRQVEIEAGSAEGGGNLVSGASHWSGLS